MADEKKKETKQEAKDEAKDEGSQKDAKSQSSFEDRLERAAEKLSGTISEGAKRMEAAFAKSKEELKASGRIGDKYKSFFHSPTGGFLLILVGVIWFLFTVGFFDEWYFPLILILIGIVLVLKGKPA